MGAALSSPVFAPVFKGFLRYHRSIQEVKSKGMSQHLRVKSRTRKEEEEKLVTMKWAET
jgi:hypothetical protein